MKESNEAAPRLEGQAGKFKMHSSFPCTVGEATEFEWNVSPGFLS